MKPKHNTNPTMPSTIDAVDPRAFPPGIDGPPGIGTPGV